MPKTLSLQDRYAPNSICFGCGPKNPRGLHVKHRLEGDEVVADWSPEPHHTAFAGFASGGIVSVLLDCSGNWAAAHSLMKSRRLSRPPGTVTAEYTVRFLKPSPMDMPWRLRAWATKVEGSKVSVAGELEVAGERTATMRGVFAAVKEGHPAFRRWQ